MSNALHRRVADNNPVAVQNEPQFPQRFFNWIGPVQIQEQARTGFLDISLTDGVATITIDQQERHDARVWEEIARRSRRSVGRRTCAEWRNCLPRGIKDKAK